MTFQQTQALIRLHALGYPVRGKLRAEEGFIYINVECKTRLELMRLRIDRAGGWYRAQRATAGLNT